MRGFCAFASAQRGIEVLGREARRALAGLARVLAMRQVIEGLDIGGERVLGTG